MRARAVAGALGAAAAWWAVTAGVGLAGLAAPGWLTLTLGAGALLGIAAWLEPGSLALRWPRWGGLPRGVVVGVALLMAGAISGWSPAVPIAGFVLARGRMMAALAPGWAPLAAVAVAAAHELLFRGVLQRRLGAPASVLAWTLAVAPLDPVRGLSTGAVLALLSSRCGVGAALTAHLAWAFAPASLSMGFTPPLALGVTALAMALAGTPARRGRLARWPYTGTVQGPVKEQRAPAPPSDSVRGRGARCSLLLSFGALASLGLTGSHWMYSGEDDCQRTGPVLSASGYPMMKLCPGSFEMGSPESEPGRNHDEAQHSVTLTRPYWLGTVEVSQGFWASVTGARPWKGEDSRGISCREYKGVSLVDPSYPVVCVSWFDALKFANRLSALEGLDSVYTLTEVESEGEGGRGGLLRGELGPGGQRVSIADGGGVGVRGSGSCRGRESIPAVLRVGRDRFDLGGASCRAHLRIRQLLRCQRECGVARLDDLLLPGWSCRACIHR